MSWIVFYLSSKATISMMSQSKMKVVDVLSDLWMYGEYGMCDGE